MGGVASTIAALGNGSRDGEIGFIQVSQGGENILLKLMWDNISSKWVSDKLNVSIEGNDSDWTFNMNSADGWEYWGRTASDVAKWNLLTGGIPFVGALYAAGLQLQDRISARMLDTGALAAVISPWFYQYNDGDTVTFSNDIDAQAGKTWNGVADLGYMPSPENIGHGVVLSSDLSNAIRLFTAGTYEDGIVSSGYHNVARNPGWDYVKFFQPTQPSGSALGGVPTTTPIVPTKKYLYPTLYGKNTKAAAIAWECRWAS